MTEERKRRNVFSALLELLGEDLDEEQDVAVPSNGRPEPRADAELETPDAEVPSAMPAEIPAEIQAEFPAGFSSGFATEIPASGDHLTGELTADVMSTPFPSDAEESGVFVGPPPLTTATHVDGSEIPVPTMQGFDQAESRFAPPPAPAPVMLTSRLAADRLAALDAIASAPVQGDAIAWVAERLASDPSVDVRMRAFDILAAARPSNFVEIRRIAMLDPFDLVRERAVAAASGDTAAVSDLIEHVGHRRWPRTHRAATRALTDLIATGGIGDADLDALLAGVALTAGGVSDPDDTDLVGLALAIPRERLAAAMNSPGDQRRGAAVLLMHHGPSGAAVVASMVEPASPPVPMPRWDAEQQTAGSNHTSQVTETAAPQPGTAGGGETPASPQVRRDIIGTVARALTDPDATVRSQAHDSLTRADRRSVIAWVREQLRRGAAGDVALACEAVNALRLVEVAPDLIARAVSRDTEFRPLLNGVLAELAIAPEDYPGLIAQTDPTSRADAIRFVAEVGGEAVWPYLRAFLRDPSGPIRLASLEALGSGPASEVADEALTQDSSPAVRAAAVKAIARNADPERQLRALRIALNDHDADVRITAVEVLVPAIGADGFETALTTLDDPDDRVRAIATRYLAEMAVGDPEKLWLALRNAPRAHDELLMLVDRLGPHEIDQLTTERIASSDPGDRSLAIELALRSRTHEALSLAIRGLHDPDPEVRRTAAGGLAGTRDPAAIPALASALKDPNALVRAEAVGALGDIDDETVIPVVITGLKDPDPVVQSRAAHVLERWRSPTVAQYLVDALSSPDLRRAAVDILVAMGEAAVEPLVDVLQDGQPEMVSVAGSLLGAIVGPESFTPDLADLDPSRRLRAVEALGGIGGPRAVDALVEALSDPDERVRVRSLVQLARLRDPRSLDPILRTFARDPVLEVVRAAEVALRSLEEANVVAVPAADDPLDPLAEGLRIDPPIDEVELPGVDLAPPGMGPTTSEDPGDQLD